MSKKVVCISALLLANILLLAHAVIPHHHHHEDAIVCFFDAHCNDCEEAYGCEQFDFQTYKHEGKPLSDKCCIIDNVYFSAHNNIKITCRSHINCDCGKVLYALISNNLNTQDFINGTEIHFRQNPYVPLFYSEFVAQSLGLRAPPSI
ncbi:MAG: hypothetical protein LBH91_06905 [Prevotellaceae bacterium]|jgi:hypothetical protein|nr:hypothetical protein [Prevotellaceae bacterium]